MKYNFDEIVPRRGSHSYKWDTAESEAVLPMWVADMDFRTAPAVTEALVRRALHGVYGYVKVPEAYYDAVIGWFGRRHRWQIEREWILYTSGVVPALSAVIQALTDPGDRVLVQTPVYNCFFSSIRNNGCGIVTNPLIYANGTYRMDFEDLEGKAADPNVRLLLLCNPHNPAGRVWTREELERVGEVCRRNNVLVISDEIHGELVYPEHTYTPFASLSDDLLMHSVVCTSPSKAFNLAGLQIANIMAADASIRLKIDKALNVNEVCDVNPFGVVGLIAAYNEGEEWLDELTGYLYANYCYAREYFAAYLPQFPTTTLEGTYLLWVDCSVMKQTSRQIMEKLLAEGQLLVNEGTMYGEAGEGFIRINLACPRQLLAEGLERLKRVFVH